MDIGFVRRLNVNNTAVVEDGVEEYIRNLALRISSDCCDVLVWSMKVRAEEQTSTAKLHS